ncbi:MAG: hypothetical protein LUD50_01070 [Clostridia bacterium]|nr:hypothetical protein [Clostridia bacterium]
MSAQTSYGFKTVSAVAGGIYDLSVYVIDAFANEEDTGVMQFGVGVVAGTDPGKTIALPTSDSTADDFRGVTVNGLTTEHDLAGMTYIRNTASIGVMNRGRVWVRVPENTEVAIGDSAYVVTDEDNAGYFTNEEGGIAVNARFIGPVNTTAWIAPIELYPIVVA